MQKYGKKYLISKTKAFNRLGYPHESTRGIWTTETREKDRVLLTIWNNQIHTNENKLWTDPDHEHPVGDPLRNELARNPKHLKRAERLRRVMNGRAELDVVVLFGTVLPVSAQRIVGAMPWIPEEQFGREWRVVSVNPENSFFRAEAS